MLNIRRQSGGSMWSTMSVIILGMMFLLLAFKLVPPYWEDSKIANALESVANRPGAGSKSSSELRLGVERMFDVDYISAGHLIAKIHIREQDSKTKILSLDYYVEIELVGNLSAVIDFEHEYKAR